MRKYYLDKNLILGTIAFQEKTVSQFCKEIGVNRCNFYQYLNRGYTARRSIFVSKLCKALNIKENLIWEAE